MINLGHMEKGLTVICNDVPINEETTLDILCYDDEGRLVIIQISVNEDDNMLLYGLQSLNYVNKFKSMLKMTYAKHKIDDRENPRLILIAPSFSETLYNAVKNMQGMHINLYEWEYLKIGDQKGLRIQPIFTSPRAWKRKAEHGDKPKSRGRLETKKKPEHPPNLSLQRRRKNQKAPSHPKMPVEPEEKAKALLNLKFLPHYY